MPGSDARYLVEIPDTQISRGIKGIKVNILSITRNLGSEIL
jgi:hypothetical protein